MYAVTETRNNLPHVKAVYATRAEAVEHMKMVDEWYASYSVCIGESKKVSRWVSRAIVSGRSYLRTKLGSTETYETVWSIVKLPEAA